MVFSSLAPAFGGFSSAVSDAVGISSATA